MGGATMTSVVALLGAVVLGGCATTDEASSSTTEPVPTTQPGLGDTMPATAFPITSVLRATEASLPVDAAVGEIPMDVRWQPGSRLDVPIERGGRAGTLTVTVTGSCGASSALLDAPESKAVADAVCRTWEAEGRLPVVVPDPDAPPEFNPEDAAR